jgi:hypothetical protein
MFTGTTYFCVPGPSDLPARASHSHLEPVSAQLLIIAIALLVLPTTISPAVRDYVGMPHSPARARRVRRYMFLGLKFGLILPIVYYGTLDLASIATATGLQPHATLVSYVIAFRWALIDQRRRCPVCLRLLANFASFGQPAQTFLGWYGTELFCIKGHGLLYVPGIPTSYSAQRWLDLDNSWSGLFLS